MKTQCSSLIFHTASVSSGTGSSVSTPSAPPWHTKVQIHALSAGHFSLPEDQFVSPASPAARKTVPSLCFLIQHSNLMTGITTRILFDLGLRRDIDRYSEPIRHHIASRQPVVTDPDITKSLRSGGLGSEDIDYIIYSHVHWDHVGEPRDFPLSTFIVGFGSLDVLAGKSTALRGGHSFFEPDLLDPARTIELPGPSYSQEITSNPPQVSQVSPSTHVNFSGPWSAFDSLPAVLDLFGDGTIYLVDAPGHLPGHINVLAHTNHSEGGSKWVYLAGDACHDRRIMRREKEIGEWYDSHGYRCCIHADRSRAEETIQRIRDLESRGVEVILAHDVEWESNEGNKKRFFGV